MPIKQVSPAQDAMQGGQRFSNPLQAAEAVTGGRLSPQTRDALQPKEVDRSGLLADIKRFPILGKILESLKQLGGGGGLEPAGKEPIQPVGQFQETIEGLEPGQAAEVAQRIERATGIKGVEEPPKKDKKILFGLIKKVNAQQPPPGNNPFEVEDRGYASWATLTSGGWTREQQIDWMWSRMPSDARQSFIDRYGNGDEQTAKDFWAKFIPGPNKWGIYRPSYIIKFIPNGNLNDPTQILRSQREFDNIKDLFSILGNPPDRNDVEGYYEWLKAELISKSGQQQQPLQSGAQQLQPGGSPPQAPAGSGQFLQPGGGL